jgi:hypothetical protein
MFARSFTFSTQSDQKSFIDGNRFLAPVDFPLGYMVILLGVRRNTVSVEAHGLFCLRSGNVRR